MAEPLESYLPDGRDIRLIFFDVDGTVLGSDGQYPPSVKQQMQRVQALGIKTAIASGRPPFACQFLFDELHLNASGLFYTGAMIFNPATGECLRDHTLERSTLARLLRQIKANDIYCELYSEGRHFVETACDITLTHAEHLRSVAHIAEFDSFVHASAPSVHKLLVGVDENKHKGQLEALEAEFPRFIFAYARFPARPNWLFASVIAREANKANAFNWLLDHHKVGAEQVLALGDSDSDIPFLQMAGTGVAMGNAEHSVQRAANFVTKTADDDGLAYALKKLIPE